MKKRTSEEPLIAALLAKRQALQAKDLLSTSPAQPAPHVPAVPNALTRTQGPAGIDASPPYPSAIAAANEAAHTNMAPGASTRGVLRTSSGTSVVHPSSSTPASHGGRTGGAARQPRRHTRHAIHAASLQGGDTPPRTASSGWNSLNDPSATTAAALGLLAVPGQLQYRRLLAVAQASRAPGNEAFIKELDGMDEVRAPLTCY